MNLIDNKTKTQVQDKSFQDKLTELNTRIESIASNLNTTLDQLKQMKADIEKIKNNPTK